MDHAWDMPPLSDSQLYDKLAALFGYGAYDELSSEIPYWKYRLTEIGKVAASRKKANCSLIEASRTAEYCKAHRRTITGPHQLWQYRADARIWWAAQQKAQKEAQLDERLNDAIAHESRIPDSAWFTRLVRVAGPEREEVLKAWEQSQGSRPHANKTA